MNLRTLENDNQARQPDSHAALEVLMGGGSALMHSVWGGPQFSVTRDTGTHSLQLTPVGKYSPTVFISPALCPRPILPAHRGEGPISLLPQASFLFPFLFKNKNNFEITGFQDWSLVPKSVIPAPPSPGHALLTEVKEPKPMCQKETGNEGN